jgi:hypothetical protein
MRIFSVTAVELWLLLLAPLITALGAFQLLAQSRFDGWLMVGFGALTHVGLLVHIIRTTEVITPNYRDAEMTADRHAEQTESVA